MLTIELTNRGLGLPVSFARSDFTRPKTSLFSLVVVLTSTMGKKVLYNTKSRRRLPRQVKAHSPYASSPCAWTDEDAVDALLTNTDTLEEVIDKARKRNTKTCSTKKKPVGKPKDDAAYATEDAPEPQNNDTDNDEFRLDDEESTNNGYNEDDDPPTDSRPTTQKVDNHRRHKTDAKSVSSTSPESSRSSPRKGSMRDKISENRVRDADARPINGGSSHKMLHQYKEKLEMLKQANRRKDEKLEQLTQNLDQIKGKNDVLHSENAKARVFISAVIKDPSMIAKSQALILKKKRTYEQATIDLDKMDDDYEDEDDEDDEDEEVFQVDNQMINEGKKAVVKVFRTIKFISTNKQEADFCDAVMDNYGKEELIYLPNADEAHKQKTGRYRRIFKATYKKHWLKYFNQYRNYTQQRVKDGVMKFMEDKKWDKLPDHKFVTDNILTRDFSAFDPVDGDDAKVLALKKRKREICKDLMDCWTEEIIPAVAGAKLVHPKIRHLEPMTTSLMPNSTDQLRVTASTEAMAAITYENCHQKFNAMRKWYQNNNGWYKRSGNNTNQGLVCPRWSSKHPDDNIEFKGKYSDSIVGKPKWGGWSDEGKKVFVQLQKKCYDSRAANKDRHVEEDKKCLARLQVQFAHLHKNMARDQQKKANNTPVIQDNDPDFDCVYEA